MCIYKNLMISFNLFLITRIYCTDIKDTELVSVFMVGRHGDRTPVKSSCDLVNYGDTVKKLTQPYGFGQLTQKGMEQGYKIGQFIKYRYKNLLSPSFNSTTVFTRTTFISRTIYTALNAIAAICNLKQSDWIQTMDWEPVPYSTVVPKYDFNAGFVNCPVYLQDVAQMSNSTNSIMMPYMWMRDAILTLTGFDMANSPERFYDLYDLFITQESVGCKLNDVIKQLLPYIEQAANASLYGICGKPKFIPLLSGVLLNELKEEFTKAVAGKNKFKVIMYTVHDVNVYPFMLATQVIPNQGIPLPGCLFGLELRKEISTGKYYVLSIYMKEPGHPITYPTIAGSDNNMCELKKFFDVISKHAMDIYSWRNKCHWNSTAYIPDCGIE